MNNSIVTGTSFASSKSRPNKALLIRRFDKEGPYDSTITTATGENNCLNNFSSSEGKSSISTGVLMTMSNDENDDSFKLNDDSNWWNSPKRSVDDSVSKDKPPEVSGLPKASEIPIDEDESRTKPTTEKKKKVKRISMIKVKASDMACISGHQFQQTGNFEADQKELQKIVMKLKAEKMARESSGKSDGTTTSPTTSKPRSQSKMRNRNTDVGESGNDHHQRSKSNGRGGRGAEIVDLTPEKRSKSVVRRSRSVARKAASDESNDCQKSDEHKKGSATRGRSVNSKRTSGYKAEAEDGNSEARIGKVRERSRSVARQRMSDIDTDDDDDDDGDNTAANAQRIQGHHKSDAVDLATGLALVDRDTRSRSVARTRPGAEQMKDASFTNLSRNSSKTEDSEIRRSKSVGRKVKSGDENVSHQSSNDGSFGKASDSIDRRSKSIGRKVKNSDDNSSRQSSIDGSMSKASDSISRRSKSVGRKVKNCDESASLQSSNDGSISKPSDSINRRSKSIGRKVKNDEHSSPCSSKDGSSNKAIDPEKHRFNEEERQSNESDDQDPSNAGNSIPWNEFLKHAQSVNNSSYKQ